MSRQVLLPGETLSNLIGTQTLLVNRGILTVQPVGAAHSQWSSPNGPSTQACHATISDVGVLTIFESAFNRDRGTVEQRSLWWLPQHPVPDPAFHEFSFRFGPRNVVSIVPDDAAQIVRPGMAVTCTPLCSTSEWLPSQSGKFALTLESGVLRLRMVTRNAQSHATLGRALWSSPNGPSALTCQAVLSPRGALEIYETTSKDGVTSQRLLWWLPCPPAQSNSARLRVTDGGTLQIVDDESRVLWRSDRTPRQCGSAFTSGSVLCSGEYLPSRSGAHALTLRSGVVEVRNVIESVPEVTFGASLWTSPNSASGRVCHALLSRTGSLEIYETYVNAAGCVCQRLTWSQSSTRPPGMYLLEVDDVGQVIISECPAKTVAEEGDASTSKSPDDKKQENSSPEKADDDSSVAGAAAANDEARPAEQATSSAKPVPLELLDMHKFVGDRLYVDDPLHAGNFLLCPSREYGFYIRANGTAAVFRTKLEHADAPTDSKYGRPSHRVTRLAVGEVLHELAVDPATVAPANDTTEAVKQAEDGLRHEYQLALMRDGDLVFTHFLLEDAPQSDGSASDLPAKVAFSELSWRSCTIGSRASHVALRDDGALVLAAPPVDDSDYYHVHESNNAHEIVWSTNAQTSAAPPPVSPPSAGTDEGDAQESTEAVLARLRDASRKYQHVQRESSLISPTVSVARQRRQVAERAAALHSDMLFGVAPQKSDSESARRAAASERVLSRAAESQSPPVNLRGPRRRSSSRPRRGSPLQKSESPNRAPFVVVRGDVDIYV